MMRDLLLAILVALTKFVSVYLFCLGIWVLLWVAIIRRPTRAPARSDEP
jgi:hypothetical protein